MMLKILQARLQQYINRELPDAQTGFRKGRGTRDQIANICWTKKARESQKKHLLLLYWLCQSLWLCHFSSVQLLSHFWLFATPWITAHQASLSICSSQSLLKLMSTELVMPSNHLILCHPLFLLPSIFPSIRVFLNESALRISFNISPSNEHPGLISFRMDWLDLLAVQGTLKSLLNTTVQKHQFFGAQLSLKSNSHIHTWLLEKP